MMKKTSDVFCPGYNLMSTSFTVLAPLVHSPQNNGMKFENECVCLCVTVRVCVYTLHTCVCVDGINLCALSMLAYLHQFILY